MLRRGDASLQICVKLLLYIGWRLTLSLPNVAKGNFDKQIASCESTGRELSFEWSHHRMLSTDSKVRVTLQISIKHSSSERVKDHMLRLSFKKGHALLKKKNGNGILFQKNNSSPVRTQNHCLPF